MAGSIGTDPYGLKSALKKPAEDENVSGDDPFGLRSALKKKENSKYVLPTGGDYSENGGITGQPSQITDSTTGLRVINPNAYKVLPTPTINHPAPTEAEEDAAQQRISAEEDAQNKAIDAAHDQYNKEHPGYWSNTLPLLSHAVIGLVTKGVAGLTNFARTDDEKYSLYKPQKTLGFDIDGNEITTPIELSDYGKKVDAGKTSDPLGKLIIGLDAYNTETAKNDYQNSLPKTFLGNNVQGLINIAPIAATAALFPEGLEAEAVEGGAAAETGLNIASLQKLKNIAVNPFTKVSAIQGGLNAYDEAKQKGETGSTALLGGVKGAISEGGQAAVYNMLGEVGANFLSPKIAKGLTESGLLKDGKLTRIGTDATADAIVFSAYPIASNLIQGKPVDWDEVEQGLGTGLAFGFIKGMHTSADFSEADEQLKQTGDAVAMKNFYDAAPEAIQAAFHLPDNSTELNAKAIDYAAKAKAETDIDQRKQLIAASSMYQKMADVKTITQAVLGNPSEFISNINADENLTPEQRAGLINKITSVPDIIKGTTKADPILNFTTAAPEDMVSAMQRPESAQELQSQAFAKKMEAQNATDPVQQAQLDAEHQQLQQHADIKAIGETVINHGIDPFTTAVNGSDLPNDVKSTLISKAHGINQEFNPVIKEQADTQQTVAELTDKIDDLQNTPGATDPVNNPAGVAQLIDMVEKRTDAQVDLLDKAIDNPLQIPNGNEPQSILGKLNESFGNANEFVHNEKSKFAGKSSFDATDEDGYKLSISPNSEGHMVALGRPGPDVGNVNSFNEIKTWFPENDQDLRESIDKAKELVEKIKNRRNEPDEIIKEPISVNHEEFGPIKFTPHEDGEHIIHYADGTEDKLPAEDIKRGLGFDPETGEAFKVPEEDLVNQQRSAGEWMNPEQVEASQKLLEKAFPNVETVFHPTTADFGEAARANGIDTEHLPNAFVDKNGRINFNPEGINKDTQLHEYGHILVQWAKENEPSLYKRMVSFGRDATDLHKELLANGYKIRTSQLHEEAFVTMLGRHGEGKLDEVVKNGGTRGTIAKFIGDVWTKFQRYLINKTGFDISKFKNIKDMPINEFLDTINSKYLLSESKIGDIGTREISQIDQQRPERPVKGEDETMAQFARRVIDWTKEQQTGQKAIDFEPTTPVTEPFKEPINQNKDIQAYDPDLIEANNAYMDAKVEGKFGVDALTSIISKLNDTNLENIVNSVKEEVRKDGNYLEKTRTKVLSNEGGSEKDQAALLMDQFHLKEQENSLIKNINNETEPEKIKRLQKTLFDNQSNLLDNALANRMIGREASSVFRLRQVSVDQDTNLAYMREKYMAANGTKTLTPEQEEFIRNQYQQIRESEEEIKRIRDEELKTRTENERLQSENDALKKIIDGAKKKYQNSKEKSGDKLTKIRKDIDGSKQRLKELVFGNTNSLGILHPEIYKELKNIAVKKAEEFYVKTKVGIDFNNMVNSVLDEIKEIAPSITERDIRDALTGNFEKRKTPLKSELQTNLADLQKQAKILNDYQDYIDNKELPSNVSENDATEINKLRAEKADSDLDTKEWNVKRYKEIQRQIKEYNDKIDKGDYTTPAKEAAKFAKSKELEDAEHDLAIRKFIWDEGRKADMQKSLPITKKIINAILAWQRFAVLSYPSTLVKLMATVAHGLITKPFQLAHQELSYQILHQIGQYFRRSEGSGIINGKVRPESVIKYYQAFATNFSIENLKNAFKGIDKADIMYGKPFTMSEGDMGSGYYNSIIQSSGRSHGYIKSFLKAPETAFANEQLMQGYVERSNNIQRKLDNESLSPQDKTTLEKQLSDYDISRPEVLDKVNILAAAQGRWAILMNDNKLVERFRQETSKLGILGDITKSELPILKIPANYFNRYFLIKYGLFQALTGKKNFITGELETPGLIHIALKGTDGMTDQNKEMLSRLVAYGSMGATLFALGYLTRNNIKQNADGSAEINGEHVSKNLLHSPIMDIYFSGAQTGNDIDKVHGPASAGDWIHAFAESDKESIKKMPFLNQFMYGMVYNLGEALKQKTPEKTDKIISKTFDKKVSDMIIPGFIKEWAQMQDENSKGDVNKRSPDGLIQTIETGIPYLREDIKKK